MKRTIESVLVRKFQTFGHALSTAGWGELSGMRFSGGTVGAGLETSGLDKGDLRAKVGRFDPTDPDMVAAVMAVLPRTYLNRVVIACRQGAQKERVRQALMERGLFRAEGGGEDLSSLDALVVPVPPLVGLLEWMADLEGVLLIGDGDRLIPWGEPGGPCLQPLIGPYEGYRRLMGGEVVPEGAFGDATVRVGVIDGGIDPAHPALARCLVERIDCTGLDNGYMDPVGHATHVAGIIAGESQTYSGVAPGAKIYDLQTAVTGEPGITVHAVVVALAVAMDQRLDILNMSFGHQVPAGYLDGNSDILSILINRHVTPAGILVCCAAGNDGARPDPRISVPGDAPGCIMVAAVNGDGRRALFSSIGPSDAPDVTGPKPNVAAPGVRIVSARSQFCHEPPVDPEGLFVAMDGTSMATPMVTGFCARGLAFLRKRGMEVADGHGVATFIDALMDSAGDLHQEGIERVGRGVPQMGRFLEALTRAFPEGGRRAAVPPGKAVSGVVPSRSSQPSIPEVAGETAPGWDAWKRGEAQFVQGVQNNLRLNAGLLLGDGENPGGADDPSLSDESGLVLRRLIEVGSKLDAGSLPVNTEHAYSLVVKRLLRSVPALEVRVKSFAGWRALEAAGMISQQELGSRVQAYLNDRSLAKGRCLTALFSPVPWPQTVVQTVSAGRASGLIWVSGPGEGPLPYRIENSRYSWAQWVNLTPMALEQRTQWCLSVLSGHQGLIVPSQILSLKEVSQCLDLPEPVVLELVRTALAGHTSGLHLGRSQAGEVFVERVSL
jgi:hypothetical protein